MSILIISDIHEDLDIKKRKLKGEEVSSKNCITDYF